jgi:hypothetical protein
MIKERAAAHSPFYDWRSAAHESTFPIYRDGNHRGKSYRGWRIAGRSCAKPWSIQGDYQVSPEACFFQNRHPQSKRAGRVFTGKTMSKADDHLARARVLWIVAKLHADKAQEAALVAADEASQRFADYVEITQPGFASLFRRILKKQKEGEI